MKTKHILVLGVGSVGKRHLKNLVSLGCTVSAMDTNPERIDEAQAVVSLVNVYNDISSVVGDLTKYDGVVIGSPANYHVSQAIEAIQAGVPVLLEKPLSTSVEEGQLLKQVINEQVNPRVLLGYTWRWWPPMSLFRQRILNDEVGRILHAKFVMSAHLADWHPWERYQDFFMAKKDLGGGALLDESHFVDLMLWFFGKPRSIFAHIDRLSSLEIETDDNVDIVAFYESGMIVTIHLDLYGRPHERRISVTGQEGTLEWSSDPNRIRKGNVAENTWEEEYFTYERNDMFVEVVKEFLQLIEQKKQVTCTVDEGIDVLRILEACKQSTAQGKVVYLY